MKRFLFFFLFLVLILLQKSSIALANTAQSSITVINLIRGNELGHEKDDLYQSLKDQWAVTHQEKVNATWLWQYGALKNKSMTNFAKASMKSQEFGLLLEIDKNYAKEAGVFYRGQGPSYFSDGLLLVSYDVKERKKLIDLAFKKFHEDFGYYPKTVGAWWIGADSIDYMQQKYGISAVLRASDQYNLDVYTIWGTPWSIPYLPSKENEGIPAASFDDSSKVVILQWAPRDPVKGYYESTYSLQDFSLKGYELSYVDYLFDIYLKNPLDNVVIGIENGGNLDTFNNFYKNMLEKAKARKSSRIMLTKDYANLFLAKAKVFGGTANILAKSFGSNDQSLWINNPNYRVLIEKKGDQIYLSDLRDYSSKIKEDFFNFTNSQGNLWIGEKYIIDSKLFPGGKKSIVTSKDNISLVTKGNVTEAFAGKIRFAIFTPELIKIFTVEKEILYNFKKNNSNNYNVSLGSEFSFNKIQTLCFYTFPFKSFENLDMSLFILKWFPLFLLPFIILFLRRKKSLQYTIGLIYFFYYLQIPYFPLNKDSLLILVIVFLAIFLIIILRMLLTIYKKRTRPPHPLVFLFAFFIVLLVSFFTSRSTEVINSFEVNALQFVKDQKKDIIFVSQQDYSIKPIYKAVRPLIYDNLIFATKMTGVNWTNELRPQNHILKITDYKNRLIFIPRYLGSDLSEYEIKELKLIKIYDNYQIAIYKSI